MPTTLLRFASLLVLGVASLAALGCNEDPGAENGQGDQKPPWLPPPVMTVAYPAGPYDVMSGATIRNYAFPGYPNAQASMDELQIQLADFYNPTGTDVYPAGSPYGAGKKKPLGLFIDIASVWCGPCNLEAKTELPAKYAKYRPCGGEFLFQLAEGAAPGTTATPANLAAWTHAYKVNYPATYDPTQQLSALYGGGSFPDGVIIDTHDMHIIEVVSGVPDDSVWKTFESTLDAACLAGH
jgi:hypothetical protein